MTTPTLTPREASELGSIYGVEELGDLLEHVQAEAIRFPVTSSKTRVLINRYVEAVRFDLSHEIDEGPKEHHDGPEE